MYSARNPKVTGPVFKKGQPDDSYKFQYPPLPSGVYPYHLNFPRSAHADQRLVFNMVGDTGGLKSPDFQRQIAEQMGLQYKLEEHPPEFLYHLGDVVYHFGEREQYETQFFKPYSHYPGPIYAIAGNHDADVNPDNPEPYQSLDAFYEVFCNTSPKTVYFSGGAARKSQIQPNVYWTLNTELATIIGLYSNVPKFGCITSEQRHWFIKELKRAAAMSGKALIVCLHHAPYSADTNHGSSAAMIRLLESAFEEAGVYPDVVFSGHVHNYQRFLKHYKEKSVPFIVAGSGGFDELHVLAEVTDPQFTQEDSLLKDVELKAYCEGHHGFIKVAIEKEEEHFTLTCEYYTLAHNENDAAQPARLYDRFTIDLKGEDHFSCPELEGQV
ncbi:metallophosphoesterase family protein [Pedobacter nutrimenti]|uniref:metallophosphoesterase family protein n=1 Tax=Pedobacter nutrimenti TaxID=1241337 RepID=UPI002931E99A|nr:metallophosphoesterase [Pedobacter nutrimenti]